MVGIKTNNKGQIITSVKTNNPVLNEPIDLEEGILSDGCSISLNESEITFEKIST
jgi:hypothetical protein